MYIYSQYVLLFNLYRERALLRGGRSRSRRRRPRPRPAPRTSPKPRARSQAPSPLGHGGGRWGVWHRRRDSNPRSLDLSSTRQKGMGREVWQRTIRRAFFERSGRKMDWRKERPGTGRPEVLGPQPAECSVASHRGAPKRGPPRLLPPAPSPSPFRSAAVCEATCRGS